MAAGQRTKGRLMQAKIPCDEVAEMVKGWDPLSLEPTNAEVQAMQDDPLEWEEIVLTHSNVDLPPFQKTILQG